MVLLFLFLGSLLAICVFVLFDVRVVVLVVSGFSGFSGLFACCSRFCCCFL